MWRHDSLTSIEQEGKIFMGITTKLDESLQPIHTYKGLKPNISSNILSKENHNLITNDLHFFKSLNPDTPPQLNKSH